MGKLDALDTTIHCLVPFLFLALRHVCVRVQYDTVGHMLGQGTMDYGSYPNGSLGLITNIGRHKPFILECAFQLLFQSSNVVSRGD